MNATEKLSEILGYYKYKVDHDLCTMEEIESAAKALADVVCELGCPCCHKA